jgi:transposase
MLVGMPDAPATSADLPDDPSVLKKLVSEKSALVREMELRIAVLEEELRLARHKRFGASSEKADPDQLGLFNEAEATVQMAPEATVDVTVPEHRRKKPGRKPLPAHLPRIRIEHDIAEAEKPCPCGSGRLRRRIGEVVTEQQDIVPPQPRVLQHVRFKYGPCGICDGVFPEQPLASDSVPAATTAQLIAVARPRAVILAPLPPQPIPKSNASARLLASIAAMKFVDGLPLYRIESVLARSGLDVPRATSAAWMIRLGQLIVPLINLMNEVQLGYDVLQMDETSVQVLKEDGRPAQSQSRMWVRRGGPAGKTVILFDYDPSRAGIVAARLLEGFKGYLQTDGYEAYAKVAACEGLVHVACLAHARRKFDEAAKANLKAGSGGLAVEGLALIQRIYRIERIAREAGMGAEQRHRLRNKSARPIWEEMRRWLDRSLGTVPPQMLTGKALGYLDAQSTRLVRVLDDGRLEVDTNLCENAIRPFVLGRKAWLFSATPAGAESSARLYSLIETAKSAGCEPYAYLAHVFAELPKAITLADIEALLPWNFTATATQSVAA